MSTAGTITLKPGFSVTGGGLFHATTTTLSTQRSTTYYSGPGGVVAFRRSGHDVDNGIFYLLRDHLGSSSVIVDSSGAVVSNEYYFPYGGNRGATAHSTLTTKRFTGQYHEAGLPGGEGLSYYNARWYDAQLGRFVSADTIVPIPMNPQSFNRMAYVLNNPLRFIDPTGHIFDDFGGLGSPLHDPGPPGGSKEKVADKLDKITQRYVNQGRRYNDLPRNIRRHVERAVYNDWGLGARAQTGWRDPATVVASTVAIWRIGGLLISNGPALLNWAGRATGLACADGDCGNEARSAQEAASRAINFAKSQQGSLKYPNVDSFQATTLKEGTIIFGGAPGQSSFYTTSGAVQRAGGSAQKLWQGLQVAPHDSLGYRPGATAYRVLADTTVAYGKALANPQYGAGGYTQFVIQEFEKVLQPIYSIPLR